MKKIHISTLGCKVNQYESASFHSSFEELGHQIVSSNTKSDVVIINTCTVTGKAGAQSRQAVRKALRQHPEAKIIITGCHAQLASQELIDIEELQNRSVKIIGNGDKNLLVDAALKEEEFKVEQVTSSLSFKDKISKLPVRRFGNRTRSYLRIQDGCNAFCTYCIVPYTRGRSRSLPVEDVIKQARIFAKEGYKEIVITGIHVGYYGVDLEDSIDICTIIEKLCHETPDIRYRLSSIEPLEISDKLLDIMVENNNFMPHLHIPLQSGNDDILLRMNRRYSIQQFAKILDVCNRKIDGIAIGLDVLAGFPGETGEQFNITRTFLEDLDFTYLHVFPYSKRPGTPAADYQGQVNKNVKNERVNLLKQLGDKKKELFYSRFQNSTRSVLVEGKRDKNGNLGGFTDNYIPVAFQGEDTLKNSIARIKLEKIKKTEVFGSILQE